MRLITILLKSFTNKKGIIKMRENKIMNKKTNKLYMLSMSIFLSCLFSLQVLNYTSVNDSKKKFFRSSNISSPIFDDLDIDFDYILDLFNFKSDFNEVESNINDDLNTESYESENFKFEGNEVNKSVTVKNTNDKSENQITFNQNEFIKNIKYPELALDSRLEGEVLINVLVNGEGKASDFKIEYISNSLFTDSVINAVMNTDFKPAVVDGETVSSWIKIPVSFKLN